MAIYKRAGSRYWRIRFTTPSGKRIQCSARTTDAQKAKELDIKLQERYWRKDKLNEQPQRLWDEAVVRWCKETKHKRSHGDDLDKIFWLEKYLKGVYLNKIDRDLIEHIAEEKAKERVTPTTVKRLLELIRAILRRAKLEWGWLQEVPPIRMPKIDNKRIRWITREEAGRLLSYLPEHLKDMAAFSLATGLRKSNVMGLKWENVDLVRRHALVHADESKTSKAIPVPLNRDAIEILLRHRGKDIYVFTYKGKPVQEVNTKAWKKALAKANIHNFRWHDLRHTWASWHVQSGTSLHELQVLGGWTSYEMVQRYAHLSSDQLQVAAERISGANQVQQKLRVVGGKKED